MTGIDVSKHQGTIDWAQVKAAGVDYAIIRIAYRGYGSDGKMRIDPQFEANINGARANGIDVGVYFFSQAVNVDEAVEEASLVLNTLNGRKLQYPVYIDMEYANAKRSGRADRISKRVRTDCAVAFCETVRNSGYKPGIYASKAFYDDELTFSRISGYNIWVAHYTKSVTDFSHRYEMWQYSEKGKISGIKYKVDLVISFYDYAKGNDMSEAGSKVIFVPDSLELAKYTGGGGTCKRLFGKIRPTTIIILLFFGCKFAVRPKSCFVAQQKACRNKGKSGEHNRRGNNRKADQRTFNGGYGADNHLIKIEKLIFLLTKPYNAVKILLPHIRGQCA